MCSNSAFATTHMAMFCMCSELLSPALSCIPVQQCCTSHAILRCDNAVESVPHVRGMVTVLRNRVTHSQLSLFCSPRRSTLCSVFTRLAVPMSRGRDVATLSSVANTLANVTGLVVPYVGVTLLARSVLLPCNRVHKT